MQSKRNKYRNLSTMFFKVLNRNDWTLTYESTSEEKKRLYIFTGNHLALKSFSLEATLVLNEEGWALFIPVRGQKGLLTGKTWNQLKRVIDEPGLEPEGEEGK